MCSVDRLVCVLLRWGNVLSGQASALPRWGNVLSG